MSSRQLSEWVAYNQLEPFGEERDDLRAAIIASVIANALGGRKGKKFKPKDFMPDFDKATRSKGSSGAEALMNKWAMVVESFAVTGGQDERRQDAGNPGSG